MINTGSGDEAEVTIALQLVAHSYANKNEIKNKF
jgi:hypothetical protein